MTLTEQSQFGTKAELLPVYLVIDTSYSMLSGEEPDRLIDRVNQIVPKIVEVCESKPSVKDKLRLSLISFNSDAKVEVPLGTKDDFVPIPVLTAGGATNFGSAFTLLRTEIENGVQALNLEGARVFRPAVFFITDGEPIDDEASRQAAFDALTDPNFKASPHIVVFGVADANPETLRKYVHRKGKVIVAKNGADAGEALGAMMVPLVSSIVASTGGATLGDSVGFTIDDDDMDLDLLEVFD